MPSERCPTRQAAPLLALLVLAALPAPLVGQAWNAPDALALVRRAVGRRAEVQADAMLRSYRTRAHGFVFFLAQVGEGLTEPPRLVKADELDVEVYWQAPDRSKQVISGWRDGAFLPTDIHYHRDHLGIVTNDFGDVIRIGEGDEVRDVPHPLSAAGPDLYDYALGDSLVIRTGADAIRVRRVEVRPRDFARPMVVGTLYLDAETAALVRFRFSFTPAAYLDRQLEDISIVLENGRYEGRYWLPYRQDVEIRRRTTWLDFPARGIIRARWEIGDYDLNPALPQSLFTGAAIGGLHSAQADTGQWGRPLADAVAGVAQPVTEQDMDALRAEAERIAGARVLSGLPASRPAIGSVSDLAKVNRVQGLALGIGGVLGLSERRVELRPSIGFGTADERVTGGLSVSVGQGATQLTAFAERQLRDISDQPVIAPILNSFTAQESGNDYGDYALLERGGIGLRHRLSGRTSIALELAAEESHSVSTAATPANGEYRANPPLGAGSLRIARVALERASGGMAVRSDLQGRLAVEGGEGDTDYLPGHGRGPLAHRRRRRGAAHPGVRRGRHRRPPRVPELRARRARHPDAGAVPGLRRPLERAGPGGVAAGAPGAWGRARLLRQHGPENDPRSLPSGRLGRAPARRAPLVGQRRRAAGGRGGARVVHAVAPGRDRGGTTGWAGRDHCGYQPGLVGRAVGLAACWCVGRESCGRWCAAGSLLAPTKNPCRSPSNVAFCDL